MTSRDYVGNTFLPYLIIKKGTFNFADDLKVINKYIQGKPYYVIDVNGGYYGKYPVFTGVLAVPIYLIPVILKIPQLETMLDVYKILALGRIAASFYTALSVAILYMIIRKLWDKNNYGIFPFLFITAYALGTNVLSIASRGLWLHTSSILLISLGILLMVLSIKNPKYIPFLSLIAGLSVIARTTNIFFAATLFLYVLLHYRKYLITFILFTTPTVILYFLQNKLLYGDFFLEGYQLNDKIEFVTPLFDGLHGLLFSPGKGFLFTTPLMFIGIIYMIFFYILRLQKNDMDEKKRLMAYLGIVFLCGLLLNAKWRDWHGADRFGPALLTEFLPITALFSYDLFDKFIRRNKVLALSIFVIISLYSMYAHVNTVHFRKSRCSADHVWTFYCLTKPSKELLY